MINIFKYAPKRLIFIASTLVLLSASGLHEDLQAQPNLRETPKRRSFSPKVIVEWQETLEECPTEKVCIQGSLYNEGEATAYKTYLRIPLGATKHIKPKITLYSKLETPVMQAGDRQEFYVELKRKISYKERGEKKIFEVGKFNFKIEPKWSASNTFKKAKNR